MWGSLKTCNGFLDHWLEDGKGSGKYPGTYFIVRAEEAFEESSVCVPRCFAGVNQAHSYLPQSYYFHHWPPQMPQKKREAKLREAAESFCRDIAFSCCCPGVKFFIAGGY